MRKCHEVAGKVVLITGAAHGIGRATALRLHELGARVAILDRDEVAAKELADQLGHRALAVKADVSDRLSVESAIAQVAATYDGIDVVIACAGIAGPVATVDTVDPASWERVIDVNLLGVMRTVHAALPHVQKRSGYVLIIASVAAVIPTPTLSAYGTSKAGVEAFARTLRMEVAHTGTAVGVAYFGLIATGLVEETFTTRGFSALLGAIPLIGAVAPVDAAADAIVSAIVRRSARAWAPGYVPFALAGRQVTAWLDPLLARLPAVRELLLDAGATR